jgi:1-acyl-sn-glycerol-3-phosphate acyltransferase
VTALLRILFVVLVAWPVALVALGLNVRHRARLPEKGPAIVAANHNSHLDTLALLTLFPLVRVPQVRPVAAADYFLANRLLAWFSLRVIGIIPVTRNTGRDATDPFGECHAALERGEILLLFPEGSRGEPEQMAHLKSGIARLAAKFPQVPVVPVFMHGLGKSMPRGTWLPVPFFCDVFVGTPFLWNGDRRAFMHDLEQRLLDLRQELAAPEYL